MRLKVFLSGVIAILLVSVLTTLALAQARARQAGIVEDEDGKPIAGATVKFDRVDPGTQFDHQNMVTDETGKFVFAGLRSGPWDLYITAPGFVPHSERVQLTAFGRNPDLTIVLKKVESLPATGTRAEAEEMISEAKDLVDQGKHDEALDLYYSYLEENPELVQIRNMIGQVLEEKGDIDGAIEEYEKVLQEMPDDSTTIFLAGKAYINKFDYDKAKELFMRLAELKPDDADTMYTLGELMLDAGDIPKAIEYYSTATTLRPTFADAHMKLGYAYYGEQQWENALKHFEKFVELAPERPEVQFVNPDIEICKQKIAEQK